MKIGYCLNDKKALDVINRVFRTKCGLNTMPVFTEEELLSRFECGLYDMICVRKNERTIRFLLDPTLKVIGPELTMLTQSLYTKDFLTPTKIKYVACDGDTYNICKKKLDSLFSNRKVEHIKTHSRHVAARMLYRNELPPESCVICESTCGKEYGLKYWCDLAVDETDAQYFFFSKRDIYD